MVIKSCTWAVLMCLIVGAVTAAENYMDYGNVAPNSDKAANFRELYRMLVQRSVDDSDSLRDLAEHLQPRAVERSPSLRLRFGRSSYLKYPRSPSLRLRFGRSDPSSSFLSRLKAIVSSAAAPFDKN